MKSQIINKAVRASVGPVLPRIHVRRCRLVLPFHHILYRGCHCIVRFKDVAITASGPCSITNQWLELSSQPLSRVRFQLIPGLLRCDIDNCDNMHMIRSGIHRKQFPFAEFTMTLTSHFHRISIVRPQQYCFSRHFATAPFFQCFRRHLSTVNAFFPSSSVAREPCAVRCPSEHDRYEVVHFEYSLRYDMAWTCYDDTTNGPTLARSAFVGDVEPDASAYGFNCQQTYALANCSAASSFNARL